MTDPIHRMSSLLTAREAVHEALRQRDERRQAEELLSVAEAERRARYKIRRYFPDCQLGCKPHSLRKEDHVGDPPICRVLYEPHLQFFRGGAAYPERLFLKANRVGGSDAAAYEVTCHLTGEYPQWWEGRRFREPGDWWAAGDTSETTRNIIQVALMGDLDNPKTGMIPAHLVKYFTAKNGVPKGIETIWVQHASGGTSSIQLKSYDQGSRTFMGTAKQGIWEDEEPPLEVHTECLLRTMTTGGIILVTFTPLQGLTPYLVEWLKDADMLDADGGVIPGQEGVFQAIGVEK